MDAATDSVSGAETTILSHGQEIFDWYKEKARPFLQRATPDHVPALDNDADRLERLLGQPDYVTICFLGHSGVGKSTLLNAVAAGRDQVLPAGGIGPLTAQATEVHFNELPTFRANYHKRRYLWQILFILEREIARTGATAITPVAIPAEELDDAMREELVEESDDPESPEPISSKYQKQATQIVAGDQFAERSLPYLADALRSACGQPLAWNTQLEMADLERIHRVQVALLRAEMGEPFQRTIEADRRDFTNDLKDHAAGFLAPIIRTIEVGWPSELLAKGIRLVDLPGVGIAQDAYRRVTRDFIREKARAVVLVVDRAGPTAETIELLRTSGYWDRLVGAGDDPDSDPCNLILAVTRVDDVANEEWRNMADRPDQPRPRKGEVYSEKVEEFKQRMRSQVADQLGKIGSTTNETVSTARTGARDRLLSTLEVHPVSAPEYRKLLLDDDDDRAFLRTEAATGVPGLQAGLIEIATTERKQRRERVAEVSERLRQGVLGELTRLDALWKGQTQATDEADRLEGELETVLEPKRRERDLRVGAFREFLEATGQTRIRELVLEAREVAEEEVDTYLSDLRNAHWATLRAAVRRGGTFIGRRAINLPDDIAGKFQEPMAAVWSQKLLKEVKSRTEQFADDQKALVESVCEWGATRTEGTTTRLLNNQRNRISRRAALMHDVGKEAVTDLRQAVKQALSDAIEKPVRGACDSFVKSGNDIGPGVKSRILELFKELARKSTKAAQEPAGRILQKNFSEVRAEIGKAFEGWGDPLQETADLIVRRHAEKVSREEAQRRVEMSDDLSTVLAGVATFSGTRA